MASYYPPISFHFKVEVLGLSSDDGDVRFTDVGGLSAELVTEEIAEGGENRFIQKYPTSVKYPALVLKRGLRVTSAVVDWVQDCLGGSMDITPMNIDIMLLNEQHQPLLTWHVVNAYPTKWSVADLNAATSAYAVESIEFAYQYFTLDSS
jgi:phage tail-like protein